MFKAAIKSLDSRTQPYNGFYTANRMNPNGIQSLQFMYQLIFLLNTLDEHVELKTYASLELVYIGCLLYKIISGS